MPRVFKIFHEPNYLHPFNRDESLITNLIDFGLYGLEKSKHTKAPEGRKITKKTLIQAGFLGREPVLLATTSRQHASHSVSGQCVQSQRSAFFSVYKYNNFIRTTTLKFGQKLRTSEEQSRLGFGISHKCKVYLS